MRLALLGCLLMGCGSGPGPAVGPGLAGLVLGVEPVPGPDDAGARAEAMVAWVGGLSPDGGFGLPEGDAVALTCAGGTCDATGAGVQRPGGPVGVLAIVVDNSGSNTAPATTCTGCPTDPQKKRAVAVRELVRRVLGRAPGWRLALFDFGFSPNGGRVSTAQLAGYTSYVDEFDPPIDAFNAGYSTYLYDALVDVLPTVAGERTAMDAGTALPARLLVVSDGEDTSSKATLAAGLKLAKEHGVTIDAVGYGQRDMAGKLVLSTKAFRDLRRIAAETGGFCTFVSADELPALFARIGELYVAGHAERRFAMPAGGAAAVSGTVGLSTGGSMSAYAFEDFR